MNRRAHSIDFVFLLIIFFFFTFCGVSVLIMASSSYGRVVNRAEVTRDERAAVAYVREAVRQNDKSGVITYKKFNGVDAIHFDLEGDYERYLYCYDVALKELFTKKGSGVGASAGNDVMALDEMTIKKKGSLLTVNMTKGEETVELDINIMSGR